MVDDDEVKKEKRIALWAGDGLNTLDGGCTYM
jgi:hypothetical protein